MIRRLYDWVFGCRHHNYSFPRTVRTEDNCRTYVVCLECGKEFAYDWSTMRRGEEQEQVA